MGFTPAVFSEATELRLLFFPASRANVVYFATQTTLQAPLLTLTGFLFIEVITFSQLGSSLLSILLGMMSKGMF